VTRSSSYKLEAAALRATGAGSAAPDKLAPLSMACELLLIPKVPRGPETWFRLVLEYTKDVVISEKREVLICNVYFVATILRQQHLVVHLHTHRKQSAILVALARPHCHDDALIQLRLSRIG